MVLYIYRNIHIYDDFRILIYTFTELLNEMLNAVIYYEF